MEYLLGVVVSIIVQLVNKYLKTNTLATYITLLLVSVLFATVYHFSANSSWWPVAVQILTMAAAFHNLILRRFENN